MSAQANPLPAGLAPDGKRDEFFYLCAINRASVVVNVRSGLLPPEKARVFARAVDEVTRTGVRTDRVIKLEPQLMKIAGPEITELHVGRSSQDMHSAYRIAIMRDDALAVHAVLSEAIACFTELASAYRSVVVPNYTNGVAAQPNSLGHYLLGISEGLVRDRERLEEFYPRCNRSPMGSTVLNGTGWPLDRRAMAALLGFDGLFVNAFDATQGATVDLPVEFAQILQSTALHTGSFIQDVMVQYAQPRPWMILQEGGDNTYVSSAMPQKRNPGIMNDTRALASSVAAGAVEMAFLMHNLVPGMQDAKNVKNRAGITAKAREMLSRLTRILRALRVSPERALEELNSDWTASQEIADILMHRYGIPFRIGHHVASGMVSVARSENILPLEFPYARMKEIFADVTAREWKPAELPMSEEEFRRALDPRAIVARRAVEGGPQEESMDAMLSVRREENARADAWREERSAAVEQALARLETEFATYLQDWRK